MIREEMNGGEGVSFCQVIDKSLKIDTTSLLHCCQHSAPSFATCGTALLGSLSTHLRVQMSMYQRMCISLAVALGLDTLRACNAENASLHTFTNAFSSNYLTKLHLRGISEEPSTHEKVSKPELAGSTLILFNPIQQNFLSVALHSRLKACSKFVRMHLRDEL